MDERRRTQVSKYLSKHLRHDPDRLGLRLAPGGWVLIEELLAACGRDHFPVSREELLEVVATSDKQRFALDEAGTCIRANQGHSVEIDLQLTPAEPPPSLFHGTPQGNLEPIRRDGLLKMNRHHVHLSPDEATASKVGARRGRPVVLEVDAQAMRRAGFEFFRSANGVWLVDSVPPEFLRFPGLPSPNSAPPHP
jgi:putative RNA 2'-phosphotransferase